MAKKEAPEGVRDIAAEVTIVGSGASIPPDSVSELCREIYAVTVAAHSFIYNQLLSATANMPNAKPSDMVDAYLALREAAEKLDDLRKEVESTMRKHIAMRVCKDWALDPLATNKIEGRFGDGFPGLAKRVTIPTFKDNPEAYNYLMDYLEVPLDLRDRGKELWDEGEFETEVLKVNWNGFQDWVNKQILAGNDLPHELTTYAKATEWQEPVLKVRKKCDLLP